MASNLYWFYDALVVALALIYLYLGAKRGLMRSVVLAVLTVASLIISWLGCQILSPVIYESFVRDSVVSSVNRTLEKNSPLKIVSNAVNSVGYGVEVTDEELDDILSEEGDVFKNVADVIKLNGADESEEDIEDGLVSSVIERMIVIIAGNRISPSTLREILDSVSVTESHFRNAANVFVGGDNMATANAIERNIIAPAVKLILKGIIWIVLMAVLMLISRLIANMFKGLNRVPIIGPVNSLLGAVLGLVECAAVVYIISQIVKLVCYMTSNSLMFLNNETVQRTHVFRCFFNFNIMSAIR